MMIFIIMVIAFSFGVYLDSIGFGFMTKEYWIILAFSMALYVSGLIHGGR